jgi:hypothetical protein
MEDIRKLLRPFQQLFALHILPYNAAGGVSLCNPVPLSAMRMPSQNQIELPGAEILHPGRIAPQRDVPGFGPGLERRIGGTPASGPADAEPAVRGQTPLINQT